jgi:RNA polymerase sigma factor (sigma-70 family)
MQAGAETQLVEASRRGETAAFAKIIERHQRAVYAVAFSGVRDRALADDVTQETFVIAWRQLGELRDPSRLIPWLCGIARNVARDTRKRRQRETLGEVEIVVDGRTPYEAMHEAEAERIVATALGQVPDVYREPLVLFYFEERSVDEVARCLGISAATTNKRLSRGRKCLAERVAVVEHHVTRRGPQRGLAAAVLAVIGVTGSASHVDASPAGKGSTMNKFAIAAVVTGALGGAGVLAITATRGDAHAGTAAAKAKDATTTASVHGAAAKTATDESCLHGGHAMPSFASVLSALSGGGGAGSAAASTDSSATPDCSEVGKHLAELEADATHGPSDRPDDATCEKCASHYTNQCESAEWTPERRACTLAAGDLMNAHLCAGGGVAPSTATPTDVPAELACGLIAKDIAATVQAAGLWSDIKDMPQQLEVACDLANWPVELRRCFAGADSVSALQECVNPTDGASK